MSNEAMPDRDDPLPLLQYQFFAAQTVRDACPDDSMTTELINAMLEARAALKMVRQSITRTTLLWDDRHLHVASSAFLQVADHTEKVLCLRVSTRPKHADQALWLRSRSSTELFESNRGLYVVTQNRLASIDIPRKHRLDTIAQQRLGKSRIVRNMLLHQFLENSRRHCGTPIIVCYA